VQVDVAVERRPMILRTSAAVITLRRPTPSAFCCGTQTRESFERILS